MTESPHNTNDAESLMSDYIDGQLDPSQCAEVEVFLTDDAEAAKMMDELIAIQSGLKSFKNEETELGPKFTEQVLSGIANDSSSAAKDFVELASMPAARKMKPIWVGLSVLVASLFLVLTLWPTSPAINNTDGQSLVNKIVDPNASNGDAPLNGSELVDDVQSGNLSSSEISPGGYRGRDHGRSVLREATRTRSEALQALQ